MKLMGGNLSRKSVFATNSGNGKVGRNPGETEKSEETSDTPQILVCRPAKKRDFSCIGCHSHSYQRN